MLIAVPVLIYTGKLAWPLLANGSAQSYKASMMTVLAAMGGAVCASAAVTLMLSLRSEVEVLEDDGPMDGAYMGLKLLACVEFIAALALTARVHVLAKAHDDTPEAPHSGVLAALHGSVPTPSRSPAAPAGNLDHSLYGSTRAHRGSSEPATPMGLYGAQSSEHEVLPRTLSGAHEVIRTLAAREQSLWSELRDANVHLREALAATDDLGAAQVFRLKMSQYAELADEHRALQAEVMQLKDELANSRVQVAELQRELDEEQQAVQKLEVALEVERAAHIEARRCMNVQLNGRDMSLSDCWSDSGDGLSMSGLGGGTAFASSLGDTHFLAASRPHSYSQRDGLPRAHTGGGGGGADLDDPDHILRHFSGRPSFASPGAHGPAAAFLGVRGRGGGAQLAYSMGGSDRSLARPPSGAARRTPVSSSPAPTSGPSHSLGASMPERHALHPRQSDEQV